MAKRCEEYKDEKHARECEYKRRWYEKNRRRVIDRSANHKKNMKIWFEEYKKTLACLKCGENHPACLDFHHRDGDEKEFNVYKAVQDGHSKAKILEEISKCDVLCCKCHRILHWEERRTGHL